MAQNSVSTRTPWLLATALLAAPWAGLTPVQASPFGTLQTLASVPATPGFPEGIVVDGNRVYVLGPARFGTAGTGPSAIQVYNRKTGVRVTTIEVAGEALGFEHAVSNGAVDAEGRLYALSTQLGLLRFTKQGAQYLQESYGAPLPDLPTCAAADPGAPCSPTAMDLPPIPNDIVFDEAGFAYVTDSLQATIFRYAPGGGAPTIWFQSPQFEGGGFLPFGANGIRLDPAREYAYIAVTSSAANPALGTIYRLPLQDPSAANLAVFHTYPNGEAPDQLAFDAAGHLYVSLALTNQISVLAPDGTETARVASAPEDQPPLDNPAGIAFDSRTKSLLIANHALLSGNPDHFAVLRMVAKDPGDPLDQP